MSYTGSFSSSSSCAQSSSADPQNMIEIREEADNGRRRIVRGRRSRSIERHEIMEWRERKEISERYLKCEDVFHVQLDAMK